MSIKTNFKELSEEGCTAMQCAEALDEIVRERFFSCRIEQVAAVELFLAMSR